MLSDPQSVTINAVAVSLPAVSRGVNNSKYQSSDGNVLFSISHDLGTSRTRRLVRIDQQKIAADPLISAQSIVYKMAIYLVVDIPKTGFTITEQNYLLAAFTTWLTTGSGANMTKVLGGES